MAKFLERIPDISIVESLADFICWDNTKIYPIYRSSFYLTSFFNDLWVNEIHDWTTRKIWVFNVLKKLSLDEIENVILKLVDPRLYKWDVEKMKMALSTMNNILLLDNIKVDFDKTKPVLRYEENSIYDLLWVWWVEEENFLNREYSVNIKWLWLSEEMYWILEIRIREIESCIKNNCNLSAIILIWSTLEWVFLNLAKNRAEEFNWSSLAPKDDKRVKTLSKWGLSNFIDVWHELWYIDLDIKKFSHSIREFRNYIHPYQQMKENFFPNHHTVKIWFQILKAVIDNLQLKQQECFQTN